MQGEYSGKCEEKENQKYKPGIRISNEKKKRKVTGRLKFKFMLLAAMI